MDRVSARVEDTEVSAVFHITHGTRSNELLVLGIERRCAGIERMLQKAPLRPAVIVIKCRTR